MYIFLQSIYKNFQVIINKIFETLTMRTGPDYDKLSDKGEDNNDDDKLVALIILFSYNEFVDLSATY